MAGAEYIPDASRSVITEDGWRVVVKKQRETLDRVPNLAATMFTREGFASLKAVAEIKGKGRAPVTGGSLSIGYQVGCQVDVSAGITPSLGFSIGPNASLTVNSSGPGLSLGMSATVTPSVETTLKPGTIATVNLATRPLASGHSSILVDQVEIKVDSCLGPVTLRSFATTTVSTRNTFSSTTVYGRPTSL